MELIASPCSWSWVKVLTSITWCPVCCRDMFHKDLSTATESAAILSTAREIMYFTKTKRSYFRFAPPTTPKVGDMTASNNSPPPGPKGWTCPCGCPMQVVVTSLIEPCINDILENQKLLSLFSLNCVPPFSCCFRFLPKFSALKKFATTGADYGLLTTSNPVGNIMFL